MTLGAATWWLTRLPGDHDKWKPVDTKPCPGRRSLSPVSGLWGAKPWAGPPGRWARKVRGGLGPHRSKAAHPSARRLRTFVWFLEGGVQHRSFSVPKPYDRQPWAELFDTAWAFWVAVGSGPGGVSPHLTPAEPQGPAPAGNPGYQRPRRWPEDP